MKRKNILIIMVLVLGLLVSACGSKKDSSPNFMDENHEPVVLAPFELTNVDGDLVSSDILGENDINIIGIWQST